MSGRLNFGAASERLQGTAAVALGLAAIVLLFVYLVPRQADIASAMNARWDRMRTVAETKAGRIRPAAASFAETPAAEPSPDPAPPSVPVAGSEAVPPPVETAAVAPDARLDAPAPLPPSPAASAPSAPPPDAASAQLLARPIVLDTATIMIRRGKVRLAGIEAAPLSRKCGENGAWFCGVEARTRFRSWLRARSITCKVPKGFGDEPKEIETQCDLSGTDIGKWLVENGFAEATPGSSYAEAEAKAKAAKLGIWAGGRAAN